MTKREGERLLVAQGYAEAMTDQELDAVKIRKYSTNVYVRKFVQQQMSLLFGENILVEAFNPDDKIDEVITTKFKRMVNRPGVRIDSKIPAGHFDNMMYGISLVNPVWSEVKTREGTEVQLTEADILPAYSFRNPPTTIGSDYYPLSNILQGIILNEKGKVEYWQTQSDGEIRQIKNVVPIRDNLCDTFVAPPMFEPIYPLLDMSVYAWDALMQLNNRYGAGGEVYITVKTPSGDDEAFVKDIIENRGKDCGHMLRENMVPTIVTDTGNMVALETIRELHLLQRSYFSPADILQQRDGGSIGGSDYAELELLLANVAAKHKWITGGWEAVFNDYFLYNGFDDGYYTRITIPTISIDKAKVWLEQAKAGHEMGVLFDNEKRDLLERKELSPDELIRLKEEQGTPVLKPTEAANLMSSTPLYPEKGLETYTKYLTNRKTKQQKLTEENE